MAYDAGASKDCEFDFAYNVTSSIAATRDASYKYVAHLRFRDFEPLDNVGLTEQLFYLRELPTPLLKLRAGEVLNAGLTREVASSFENRLRFSLPIRRGDSIFEERGNAC